MAAPMDLMAVGVHGEDQDHDAAHDASGHGAHWGAFNHVQRDNLITYCPHVIDIGTFGSNNPPKHSFWGAQ